MDNTTIIKVTNRDDGPVGYYVPDLRQSRRFTAGETKEVPLEELKKLYAIPGGDILIKDFLCIHDAEVYKEIVNENTEPEYFYTDEDIKTLLKSGTLDQLTDFLNFAPAGGIEVMKKLAVELPLDSNAKIDIIKEKIGYDVSNAIRIKKESEDEDAATETHTSRRAAPINQKAESEDSTPKRKYNVVNRK